MNFLQKFCGFIASPSHSRTMGILVMLVLVSAVSLTVVASQQQQTIRQRASVNPLCESIDTISDCTFPIGSPNTCSAETSKCKNGQTIYECTKQAAGRTNICTQSGGDWKCPLPNYEETSYKAQDFCNSVCVGTGICSGSGSSWKCSLWERTSYGSQDICNSVCNNVNILWQQTAVCDSTPAAPTATTSFTCGDKDCFDSQTCVGSLYRASTYCLQKNAGLDGSYCGTPDKKPNNEICQSNKCDSNLLCSAPANLTPTPTPTPTPTISPTDTADQPFTCTNQTGTYAGNYTCANIVNGTTQCPSGYSSITAPSPYTSTSCGTNQGCCKQNLVIPTAAPIPTFAPVTNLTLGLTLNVQDSSATVDTINVALYNYNNATKVAGAPATLAFTKTSIPGKQYQSSIVLTNLAQGTKYYIVIEKDNMIARSIFTASSATGELIAPTATLVFGDLNNDNRIDILDTNYFKDFFATCYKKSVAGSCAPFDFDKNGVIDQIDYNTLLRGFVTWNKEGQNL